MTPSEIQLHSKIPLSYRQEVEDMFFFNPKQHLVQSRVREHVALYGAPELSEQAGLLTLKLGNLDQAQPFFIMVGPGPANLAGLLLYVREGDCLRVLYLALKPAYTRTWQDGCFIIADVLRSLRETGRRIKGINSVKFSVSGKDVSFHVPGT